MKEQLTIEEHLTIKTSKTRLQFTERGFRLRASEFWNKLPQNKTENLDPRREKQGT